MKKWRFVAAFVLITLMVPLVPFAIFGELPGETWVEHPSALYVFGLGILVLAGDIFLPVPSSLIAVFLGARLGFGVGSLAIMIGLSLGTAVGYYSGWYGGYPLVARSVPPAQLEWLHNLENRLGYLSLALVRSIPILAEASVLAAGAARWSPRHVLGYLFVANLCLAAVYAFFGATSSATNSAALLFAGGVVVPVAGVLITLLARQIHLRLAPSK